MVLAPEEVLVDDLHPEAVEFPADPAEVVAVDPNGRDVQFSAPVITSRTFTTPETPRAASASVSRSGMGAVQMMRVCNWNPALS
jgi:hypothetical protein